MRYIAAYLLAALNPDNKEINAKLITEILAAGGVEADQEKVTQLLKDVQGKSLNDLLSAGRSKMTVVSSAAASSTTTATATTTSSAGPTESKKEAPKKEKTPEVSEEDADGLLDFF